MDDKTIYQFSVERLSGDPVSLSHYRGKVLLIVNTASACGFTPQLKELEELRALYEESPFEILAFPSNDFGRQEPLEGEAIAQFCEVQHGTHFRVFNKIRVRGPHVHPLYHFLANKTANGRVNSVPKWNFHKYLINKKGQVVDFYYPFTKPNSKKVKKHIARLLAEEI